MSALKETTETDGRRATAVARGLAHAAKVKMAGPEFLLAGLLQVLGQTRAEELLKPHGVDQLGPLFSAFSTVVTADLALLAPVRPSSELERLMRGALAPVLTGPAAAEDAVKLLLDMSAHTEWIKRLLALPAAIHPSKSSAVRVESTRILLRDLSCFYQRRWRLGHAYHAVDPKRGTSDFTDGGQDTSFFKAVDDLYADEPGRFKQVFRSRIYHASILGHCWREHGEIAAHVLGMVLLGEVGQVGDGPLTVREIAFSLSPKYYHRHLAVARAAIAQLREHDLVQAISGGEIHFLGQTVVPTAEALDEFVIYLRDADPISSAEQQDILREL